MLIRVIRAKKRKKLCIFAPNNQINCKMKKILIALLTLMPMLATAQDNTWERVEQEPVEKTNPDAKYLEPNAVPVVDGKVCWETVIEAPGKSAQQVYEILKNQLVKMTKEPNQIENSTLAIHDSVKYELGAVFHEWLVFKDATLVLDRTQFNFQLLVYCSDGKADVKMTMVAGKILYEDGRFSIGEDPAVIINQVNQINKEIGDL